MTFLLMNAPSRGGGSLLFEDDFASGDFSKTMNGCAWGDVANVSIQSGFSPAGNTGHCAKFNFDIPLNDISELRFALNQPYTEIWLGLKLFMPNGDESPSRGPKLLYPDGSGGRNKLLRLWSSEFVSYGAYSNVRSYPAVGAGWQPAYLTGGISDGDAGLGPSAGVFYHSGGTISFTDDTAPSVQTRPFLTDANRGRWIELEFYAKRGTLSGSGVGNGDGILRTYLDGSLLTESVDLPLYEKDSAGFDSGYIMGAVDRLFTNAGSCLYLGYFGVSTTGRVF